MVTYYNDTFVARKRTKSRVRCNFSAAITDRLTTTRLKGVGYSLEYTGTSAVIVTADHAGRCCTNVLWGLCCVLSHPCSNDIPGHSDIVGCQAIVPRQCIPAVARDWPTHGRAHKMSVAHSRAWKSILLRGGFAQGVLHTATIIDLLCFFMWVTFIPDSPTRAVWQ
jgi:hypothetical protein